MVMMSQLHHSSASNSSLGQAGVSSNAMSGSTNEDCGIRDVWAHNLEEEFKMICHVVKHFPYVAMDTEFPGVVARPIGDFKSSADYQYQLLRCNVDLLKIIQLGLTFFDESGALPTSLNNKQSGKNHPLRNMNIRYSTWQFNFKFNLTEDMYAKDSVDLLHSSGIQFEKHERDGIDPIDFAEIMLMSGLVLMEPVCWLSFSSGYDFGYLLSLLTNKNLPKAESDFFETLKLYFPNVYDVKYLMKSCKNLKGGLQEVANELEVQRIGPQHQAGSDSLLTGQTFFRMRDLFFESSIDDTKYCGYLYGLGTISVVPPGCTTAPALPTAPPVSSSSKLSASPTKLTSSAKSKPSAALKIVRPDSALAVSTTSDSSKGKQQHSSATSSVGVHKSNSISSKPTIGSHNTAKSSNAVVKSESSTLVVGTSVKSGGTNNGGTVSKTKSVSDDESSGGGSASKKRTTSDTSSSLHLILPTPQHKITTDESNKSVVSETKNDVVKDASEDKNKTVTTTEGESCETTDSVIRISHQIEKSVENGRKGEERQVDSGAMNEKEEK